MLWILWKPSDESLKIKTKPPKRRSGLTPIYRGRKTSQTRKESTMQRTVKEYTFSYADVVISENNTPEVTIKTVTIRTEYTQEKAFKKAVKEVGYMFKPAKVEAVDRLYIMDDETFFKYATVKE